MMSTLWAEGKGFHTYPEPRPAGNATEEPKKSYSCKQCGKNSDIKGFCCPEHYKLYKTKRRKK